MVEDRLAEGLTELGLQLDPEAQTRLTRYLALIEKWNRVYNLTAIKSQREMVVEHLLDSLAILQYVQQPSLLDVGSGAGLPGIPIAIAQPNLVVTLLDSNSKKTAFLQQAIIELQLANASALCARVETYRPERGFATVTTRAFADTPSIAKLCAPLLAPGGIVLAMKGAVPEDELGKLPGSVAVQRIVPLRVPGLAAQRHLLIMTKAS